MNDNIYVINLDKSVERKNFIIQQFENNQFQQNVHYQFFTAINGKENPDFYLFKKYNEQKRFHRKGNSMTLSQLGCFASHYLLWEKCLELNKPLMILEDDAIIQPNFSDVYQFCLSEKNSYEFIWLSPPAFQTVSESKNNGFQMGLDNSTSIIRFWGKNDNATGYYLTPSAARKLVAYCQEWIYEVDITIDRYWENKLAIYTLSQPCVKPSFTLGSNIEVNKNRKNRTIKMKILREYYKLIDNCKKQWFRLTHRGEK